jgi:aldehyde:ferredoxin oxidoreductase
MKTSNSAFYGYQGRWAWVDLTTRKVRVTEASADIYQKFIGGRGVQAALLWDKIQSSGPLSDPLSPENRIIIGSSSLNDTPIPTAGRGSCSFISPLTYSPRQVTWLKEHQPVYGLLTHSSCGGHFPNRLKRAGFDQIIIDGRADRPVRLVVAEGEVEIIEAEDALFETVNGQPIVRPTSAIIAYLEKKYPGSSTLCLGPAGWNLVPYANLTADYHRNFGRGGGGAVFGSKNLIAVTVRGKEPVRIFNNKLFDHLARQLDELIRSDVADSQKTVSFRPETGTTWWLDRAFKGGFLGGKGGYLPWHNFDEGYFEPSLYEKVSTRAFLEIAGQHQVCHRCRYIFCTRRAKVDTGRYKGEGVRPEFETIALWINCCLLDREAIFYLNKRANELGMDTMSFGSLAATAMELTEKGFLEDYQSSLHFGAVEEMISFLESIAYQSSPLGRLFGRYPDSIIDELTARVSPPDEKEIVFCFTQAYGGLGYAGIEPKVFPGMFTAYGTSNRGRGDHTYAWTIQAEEAGLVEPEELAAYIIQSQQAKALIDSLGLCDFFTGDIFSELFLSLYQALTGVAYDGESFRECGQRIYHLERKINNLQGRKRKYDAFIPPKFLLPLTEGPYAGRAVDPDFYYQILDFYYRLQGWTEEGEVREDNF